MNRTKIGLWLVGLAMAGLVAFAQIKNGSVKGTVNPPTGADMAWIISGMDSVKAPIANGAFEFTNVKPGTYKVVVEAKPPYKNFAKEGITVTDGQATDLGEIKLSQ